MNQIDRWSTPMYGDLPDEYSEVDTALDGMTVFWFFAVIGFMFLGIILGSIALAVVLNKVFG